MQLKVCPCGRYKCYVHPISKTTDSVEDINGAKHPGFIEYDEDCGRTWELDVASNFWSEVV